MTQNDADDYRLDNFLGNIVVLVLIVAGGVWAGSLVAVFCSWLLSVL